MTTLPFLSALLCYLGGLRWPAIPLSQTPPNSPQQVRSEGLLAYCSSASDPLHLTPDSHHPPTFQNIPEKIKGGGQHWSPGSELMGVSLGIELAGIGKRKFSSCPTPWS